MKFKKKGITFLIFLSAIKCDGMIDDGPKYVATNYFEKLKHEVKGLPKSKRIELLFQEHHAAAYDFDYACRNNVSNLPKDEKYTNFASYKTLKALGLLKKDGNPRDSVKQLILKHVKDEGHQIKFVPPRKETK